MGDLTRLRIARAGGKLCAEFKTNAQIKPYAAFVLTMRPQDDRHAGPAAGGGRPGGRGAEGERSTSPAPASSFRKVDATVGIDGNRLSIVVARAPFARAGAGAAAIFDSFRFQAPLGRRDQGRGPRDRLPAGLPIACNRAQARNLPARGRSKTCARTAPPAQVGLTDRADHRDVEQEHPDISVAPRSWLCPEPADRVRAVDMEARLRPFRRHSFVAIAVALLACGHWVGWWTLIPLAVAVVGFALVDRQLAVGHAARDHDRHRVAALRAGDRRLDRADRRPQEPGASRGWSSRSSRCPARFNARAVAVGVGVAFGLLLLVTFGVDARYIIHHPHSVDHADRRCSVAVALLSSGADEVRPASTAARR